MIPEISDEDGTSGPFPGASEMTQEGPALQAGSDIRPEGVL